MKRRWGREEAVLMEKGEYSSGREIEEMQTGLDDYIRENMIEMWKMELLEMVRREFKWDGDVLGIWRKFLGCRGGNWKFIVFLDLGLIKYSWLEVEGNDIL